MCFRFQNEYNKVVIELRVMQFWPEIKLVITNRAPASVITRLISEQIALHSVQLRLSISGTEHGRECMNMRLPSKKRSRAGSDSPGIQRHFLTACMPQVYFGHM